MEANIEMSMQQENWVEAAQGANNLSELQLTLGDVAQAVQSGQRSVKYADRSRDDWQRVGRRVTLAVAYHQYVNNETLNLFQDAEGIIQQGGYEKLFGNWGFSYCDLLLDLGNIEEVLERTNFSMEISINQSRLLDIALDQLTLGRAYLQQAISSSAESGEGNRKALAKATHWLDQAVAGLRAAGQQDYLPRGLLTRAALRRRTGDLPRANRDLQEVFDIAEPSEMRLYLTDYHLEMARLLLAENDPEAARQHADTAGQLIEATGYKRRLPELAELRERLDGLSAL